MFAKPKFNSNLGNHLLWKYRKNESSKQPNLAAKYSEINGLLSKNNSPPDLKRTPNPRHG